MNHHNRQLTQAQLTKKVARILRVTWTLIYIIFAASGISTFYTSLKFVRAGASDSIASALIFMLIWEIVALAFFIVEMCFTKRIANRAQKDHVELNYGKEDEGEESTQRYHFRVEKERRNSDKKPYDPEL